MGVFRPRLPVGLDERKLAAARAQFHAQCARGRFPGGQLVVRHRGAVVIDEAIGVARGARADEGCAPVPVTRATGFDVWSASKPLVAMTIAALEEDGVVDLDAPVARYVEEFAANGKAAITVRDLLTHRSGINLPALGQDCTDWIDRERSYRKLAAAAPRWPRGTLVYHPYEYGFGLAAVVERATGRRFEDVLAERIATPAQLDLRFAVAAGEIPQLARSYMLGSPVTLSGVRYDRAFEDAADREMATSFVPGGSMIATASTLARFYELLLADGVAANARRVWSAATVRRYTARCVHGFDRVNRVPFAFGLGFMRGTTYPSLFGWYRGESCYGHSGAASTHAFADERTGLAVAIVTNGNRSIRDFFVRTAGLAHAIRRAF